MAKLRIFVSSTCYDLGVIRSELRPFISSLGYEPVMSDYSDILYDPRSHTHESCIKEVPNCDMVLLIIGPRFGGTGIPSVLENFDFDVISNLSSNTGLIENKDKLSITQLEILKAVEQSIPVYAFVDESVLHDHHVYEKNKDKPSVIKEIEFPSIQKKETAKYIFEFINFLTHRTTNNSIASFSRLEDIKSTLVGQWSQLFQRLLSETRKRSIDSKRYLDFSERLDDLKAVILASIDTPNLRETARGAIQYRHLISFLSSFEIDNYRELLVSDFSWEDVLQELDIKEIKKVDRGDGYRHRVYFIKEDGTFYESRFPARLIDGFKIDWANFCGIDKESRQAIVDATLQDRNSRRIRDIRYVPKQFDEHMDEMSSEQQSTLDNDS